MWPKSTVPGTSYLIPMKESDSFKGLLFLFLSYYYYFFILWQCHVACGTLVPGLRIEPVPLCIGSRVETRDPATGRDEKMALGAQELRSEGWSPPLFSDHVALGITHPVSFFSQMGKSTSPASLSIKLRSLPLESVWDPKKPEPLKVLTALRNHWHTGGQTWASWPGPWTQPGAAQSPLQNPSLSAQNLPLLPWAQLRPSLGAGVKVEWG